MGAHVLIYSLVPEFTLVLADRRSNKPSVNSARLADTFQAVYSIRVSVMICGFFMGPSLVAVPVSVIVWPSIFTV